MKIPLSFIALVVCACGAFASEPPYVPAPEVARFNGAYFGVALPVGACTSERLIMSVQATNGVMIGTVVDWLGAERTNFDHVLNSQGTFNCLSGPDVWDDGWNALDPSPNVFWSVQGKFNAKTGTVAGTLDARNRGGCKYTFKLWRQLKNN